MCNDIVMGHMLLTLAVHCFFKSGPTPKSEVHMSHISMRCFTQLFQTVNLMPHLIAKSS